MAQHDYVLDNQAGAAFRSDLNSALAAAVTQNSGPGEPATTYAYMLWADTSAAVLKQRNAANSAWITLWPLATGPFSPFSAEFASTQQTFASSSGITVAHGLGVVPKNITVQLVCVTADAGYAVGDVVQVHTYYDASNRGIAISADATNVYVGFRTLPTIVSKDGSTSTAITATSWRAVVRAYK